MTDPRPDLTEAQDTDEIHRIAAQLAAWGLRNGHCDVDNVVDWVLDHPHEEKLPRGSHGLNPTRHHIVTGAQYAADTFVPGLRTKQFDPTALALLGGRIAGSGARHEKYLLAAVQLCEKYETWTPVITGPLLADLTGVSENSASKVLRQWSVTLADGFFTKVTYDGIRGHGRIWHVNPDWVPVPKVVHEPGCNRSASRCRCRKKGYLSLAADKIDNPNCDRFRAWLEAMPPNSPVTVTATCRALGITRAAATKLLREHEGTQWLKSGTYAGGRRRTSKGWVRQGQTWFTEDKDRSSGHD